MEPINQGRFDILQIFPGFVTLGALYSAQLPRVYKSPAGRHNVPVTKETKGDGN